MSLGNLLSGWAPHCGLLGPWGLLGLLTASRETHSPTCTPLKVHVSIHSYSHVKTGWELTGPVTARFQAPGYPASCMQLRKVRWLTVFGAKGRGRGMY